MSNFSKKQTDIAKGLAIILMLMYHLFYEASTLTEMGVIYAPIPKEVFLTIAGFGNICVGVFVFLTGFGISKSIYDHNKDKEITLKVAYKKSLNRFGKLILNFFVMYLSVNLLFFHFLNYPSLYGEGKQGILAMLIDSLGFAAYLGTPTLNMTWWYMGIAYSLIFIAPLFAYLFKKVGYPILALGCIIPFAVALHPDLSRYFCVMVLGVAAAYGSWFEKLINGKLNRFFRLLIEIVLVVVAVLIRQNFFVHEYLLSLVDGPIAFIVILLAVDILGFIPGIREVFAFIGKHSMNMYFVHTFFYLILFRQFVYQFKYWGLTLLVLLVVSLAYSFVLDLIKTGVLFAIKKIDGNK